MNRRHILVATILGACSAPSRAGALIVPVSHLPGFTDPRLTGLAPDGTATVGRQVGYEYIRPLCWTLDAGTVDIAGAMQGGGEAIASSGGGRVITGFGTFHAGTAGYRWSADYGWTLMPMPAGSFFNVPIGVSMDGLAIGGYVVTSTARFRPYRWTEKLGLEWLPSVPPSPLNPNGTALALAMSGDGSTIAGVGTVEPFIWHRSTGLVVLSADMTAGTRPGLSFDGRFFVGTPRANHGPPWLYDRRSQELTFLDWHDGSVTMRSAQAVSADGSQVFGQSSVGVYVWDQVHRGRRWADVLAAEHNLDTSDWVLVEPIGISVDGQVIAGNGYLNGVPTGWVVMLSNPTPYPGREACQGDVDGNARVNWLDMALVMSQFNTWGAAATCDVTGDDVVDALDLNIVLLEFGDNCAE